MKFNKKEFSRNLFNKIMKTIKPKLSNINLIAKNGYLEFTNSKQEKSNVDMGVITNTDVMKYMVANPGSCNLNPHGILKNVDFKNAIAAYGNDRVKISTDTVNGASTSLECNGDYLNIEADTPFPYHKNMKYRVSVDVKAYWRDNVELSEGGMRFYLGLRAYDGDDTNKDVLNKVDLGNKVYAENVYYRSAVAGDLSTAFKYVLSREFKKGDTNVYFTTDDINNWHITLDGHGNAYHAYQAMKFHRPVRNKFCFVSHNGKVQNHLGYTKDTLYGEFLDNDTSKAKDDPLRYFKATGDTVNGKPEYEAKIKSNVIYMWRGKYDSYPVGSVGLQTRGSGEIYYLSSRRYDINNKWKHYKSDWQDLSAVNGLSNWAYYRDGAVLARLFLISGNRLDDTNKSRKDLIVRYSNMSIEFSNLD